MRLPTESVPVELESQSYVMLTYSLQRLTGRSQSQSNESCRDQIRKYTPLFPTKQSNSYHNKRTTKAFKEAKFLMTFLLVFIQKYKYYIVISGTFHFNSDLIETNLTVCVRKHLTKSLFHLLIITYYLLLLSQLS